MAPAILFKIFIIALAALAVAGIITRILYKLFNRPTEYSERKKISGSIGH